MQSDFYKSFDKRFSILPIGTLSKNKLIGAQNNDLVMLECRFLEDTIDLQHKKAALNKTKNE